MSRAVSVRSYICMLALTVSPAVAPAAVSYSADAFLASAFKDYKVELQKKNEDEFGKSSGFKPIESLQLRLSRDEVMQNRSNVNDPPASRPTRHNYVDNQGIALRIAPRGFKQLKLMGALSENQNRIEALATQKAVNDSLSERYLALVEYFRTNELRRLWTQLSKVERRRLEMVRKASRSSVTSASDLVKQRQNAESAEVKASLAESEFRIALAHLKTLDPQSREFKVDEADLITPEQMLKVVKSTPATESNYATELTKELATREKDSLRYDIAKDERLIDYVEFGYSNSYENRLLRDDKEFGIRVGINIPGFSSSELSHSNKARELVKYEIEAREAQRENLLVQTQAQETLAQFATIHASLDRLENSASEKRVRKLTARQDPLLSMGLEADSFERQIRRTDVFAKMAEQYVLYLGATGALASRSQTNFLARDLRELKP